MRSAKSEMLMRKLERVQALYQNPGSPGERLAAANAIRRIQEKLFALKQYSQPTIREYEFSVFTKR